MGESRARSWRRGGPPRRAARRAQPELWLADTAANALLVFGRSSPRQAHFDVALELGREDVLRSPLLPGFELALAELFSGP